MRRGPWHTQDPRGFWDPTEGLATALLAQRILPRDVAHLRKQNRAATGLRTWVVLAATNLKDNAGEDVQGGALSSEEAQFCPLTGFDASAIEWCMPPVLKRLTEVAGSDDNASRGDALGGSSEEFTPLRIWVSPTAHPALLFISCWRCIDGDASANSACSVLLSRVPFVACLPADNDALRVGTVSDGGVVPRADFRQRWLR